MMFGRKRELELKRCVKTQLEEVFGEGTLLDRVKRLEQKVKQLECKHNFTFDYCSSIGIWGETNLVHHKCTDCDKTTMKRWDNVAKKGQQALKLLNLVPKDWKIKGDK